MDELVQRLRWLQFPGAESELTVMMARAADRIERLEADHDNYVTAAQADIVRLESTVERLEAERDAALALLVAARPFVESGLCLSENGSRSQADIFRAAQTLQRIDAARGGHHDRIARMPRFTAVDSRGRCFINHRNAEPTTLLVS